MSKRIFSLILAAVMVFSLLPVFASAEEENPARVAPAKTIENKGWTSDDSGLPTRKELSYDPDSDTYTITMEAYATGEVISQKLETGYPLDIAIVVDQSGSMDRTVASLVPAAQTSWTLSDLSGGTYYVKDGSQYYPVQIDESETATAYTDLSLSSVLSTTTIQNRVDRSTNNDTYIYYFYPTDYYTVINDTYHRIYASFQHYTYNYTNYYAVVLTYFQNENDYRDSYTGRLRVNPAGLETEFYTDSDFSSLANSNKIVFLDHESASVDTFGNARYNNPENVYNSFQFQYPLYKVGTAGTSAYYVKQTADGERRVNLIEDSDGTYSGTLYTNGTAPKYQVLRQAVTDFCQTVADKAVEYNTEHKIALIGFAGNEVVNLYNAKPEAQSVYHSSHTGDANGSAYGYYDYVNTGLFVDQEFINYQTITGFKRHTAEEFYFTNVHYFIKVGNKMHPIAYNESAGRWYDVETSRLTTSGANYDYVSYSSNPGYSGYNTTRDYYEAVYKTIGEYGEANGRNYYQEALVTASDGNGGVNTALTHAIGNIGCLGGTYTSYGLAMANQIFANNTGVRPRCIKDEAGNIVDRMPVQPLKVVILFTDGTPGGSGFEDAIAGEALADAAIAKETYGAQVYALGLFDDSITGSNQWSTKVEPFMKGLSSDEFARTNNVAWADLDPAKTYYYTNEIEGKTYSVSCKGDTSLYIIETTTNGGVRRYTPQRGSSYLYIENPGNTDYWSYLYTLGTDGEYHHVSRSTTLDRNKVYYVFRNEDGSLNNSATNNPAAVTYDYYWMDSNGYVKFAKGGPHTRPSDTQYFTYESTPSGETQEYYATVSDAYSLTSRFNAIASNIQTPTSYAALTADNSALKDIITDHFTLPENPDGHVTLQTVEGTYVANGQPDWTTVTDNPPGVRATWNGKTLEVRGFDYSDNFIGDTHNGKKLVVTVSGLKLNADARGDDLNRVFSNTDASGIYKTTDESESMYQPFDNPYFLIVPGDVTYVADFSAKLKLAEGVTDDKYLDASEDNHNGTFERDADGYATYQLSTKVLNGTVYPDDHSKSLTPFESVDTAAIYGQFYTTSWEKDEQLKTMVSTTVTDEAKSWKNVTVVPGSSVYYDDDFSSAVTVGDGSGYNVGVNASTATTRLDNDNAMVYTFYTFTGTGIDVYCTTKSTGGYVQATLYNDPNGIGPDAAVYTNKVAGTDTLVVRNYSNADRFNVPSVSFTGQDYATYTLMISAPAKVNYYIDGVRVYNPMDLGNQDVYQDVQAENNVTFVNLNDQLLNKQSEYVVPNPLAGEGAATIANIGTLFIDKVSELVKDEDGGTKVYADKFAAYEAEGPDNEIYLSAGQGVTFQLANTSGYQYWIGLSAPDAASNVSGSVTVNDTTIHVDSPVDMYYPITDLIGTDGSVTITNASEEDASVLISITNLKVSAPTTAPAPGPDEGEGSQGQAKALFAPLSMRSVMLAANNGADPDAETEDPGETNPPEITPEPSAAPTQQPTISQWIQQIISNFVNALFNSIARLFGN